MSYDIPNQIAEWCDIMRTFETFMGGSFDIRADQSSAVPPFYIYIEEAFGLRGKLSPDVFQG